VVCLLAMGEGSISYTEAWRDEENTPRVGRPIGRVNVDDSVADVPHTPNRTRSRVGSRGTIAESSRRQKTSLTHEVIHCISTV
jgi:hypothetical protein